MIDTLGSASAPLRKHWGTQYLVGWRSEAFYSMGWPCRRGEQGLERRAVDFSVTLRFQFSLTMAATAPPRPKSTRCALTPWRSALTTTYNLPLGDGPIASPSSRGPRSMPVFVKAVQMNTLFATILFDAVCAGTVLVHCRTQALVDEFTGSRKDSYCLGGPWLSQQQM